MKKFLIVILIGLVAFGYFSAIYSDEKTPAQKWSDAEKALKTANERMGALNKDLAKYRTEFSQLSRNALSALLVVFSPVDAAKTLFLGSGAPNRAFELKTLMISIFVQQEALNAELANLTSARDTAYEAYKKTTSQPADKINQPQYVDIPTIYLPCMGGCGTTYSSKSVGMGNLSSASLQGHAVYCSSEPHKRNKNWYWSCQYSSCPASEDHETTACVGGCGNLGPEEWGLLTSANNGLITHLSKKKPDHFSPQGMQIVTIASHKKQCPKSVQLGNGTKGPRCPYYYYQCRSSNTCPNASNHYSSSSSTPPTGSTPPSGGSTPPTDNTPNCQDCTTHCSSPCSCTNSGTCGGTVTPPPEPPPSDGCSGNCWYGEGCAVTCVHCLEPYNICTSQPGDCSVDPDGWHSSE